MADVEQLFEELLNDLLTTWQRLEDKPEESPENTLRALWVTAAGTPVSAAASQSHLLTALSCEQAVTLRNFVRERMAGVPLAYITGRQQFMDIDLIASPKAMIPRVETEILAKAALALMEDMLVTKSNLRVIDLCTGSGNIAVTLAAKQPACKVFASDLSPSAVEIARQNANLDNLHERVQFFEGDLFAPFEQNQFFESVDLVTCNPPYISSMQVNVLSEEIRGYEPRLAFDGGTFGVSIFHRLIHDAPNFLTPGGQLVFEVGVGQGPHIQRFLQKNLAYTNIKTFLDENNVIRAISAQKSSPGNT